MLWYRLKCRKNTEIKNAKFLKNENGRIMLSSNCTFCNIKKARFIKEQEANRLLSNLGIRKPLSEIPFVGLLLF